jgi:hypothetical protein
MTVNRESLNLAGAFVAAGLIAILGFITWALVFVTVPPDNQNTLTLVIGILSANVGLVVGFFFGSSVTNKKQAETIDKQAATIQEAQSALAPLSPAPTVNLGPGESAVVQADGAPK